MSRTDLDPYSDEYRDLCELQPILKWLPRSPYLVDDHGQPTTDIRNAAGAVLPVIPSPNDKGFSE